MPTAERFYQTAKKQPSKKRARKGAKLKPSFAGVPAKPLAKLEAPVKRKVSPNLRKAERLARAERKQGLLTERLRKEARAPARPKAGPGRGRVRKTTQREIGEALGEAVVGDLKRRRVIPKSEPTGHKVARIVAEVGPALLPGGLALKGLTGAARGVKAVKVGAQAGKGTGTVRGIREARSVGKAVKRARPKTTRLEHAFSGASTLPHPAVRGYAEATTESPGKVAKTTGRAIAGTAAGTGRIVADVGITGARLAQIGAAKVAKEKPPYTLKQATYPVRKAAKSLADDTTRIAKLHATGSKDEVKKFVKEEGGLLVPLTIAAPISKVPSVRRRVKSTAGKMAAKSEVVDRTVGKGRAQRREVSEMAARHRTRAEIETVKVLKPARKAVRKVAKKDKEAVSFLGQRRVSKDPAKAKADLIAIREKLPEGSPDRALVERVLANPAALTSKSIENVLGVISDKMPALAHIDPETSYVGRHKPMAYEAGIRTPGERVPAEVRPITSAKTRDELKAEAHEQAKTSRVLIRQARAKSEQAKGVRRARRGASSDAVRRLATQEAVLRREAKTARAEGKRIEAEAQTKARVAKGKAPLEHVRRDLDATKERLGRPLTQTERTATIRATHERFAKDAQAGALAEFRGEIEGFKAREGRGEPIYVRQTSAADDVPKVGRTVRRPLPAAPKRLEGKLQAKGDVRRGIEDLLHDSITAPISQSNAYRLAQEFHDAYALHGGKEVTAREAAALKPPKDTVAVRVGEIRRAIEKGDDAEIQSLAATTQRKIEDLAGERPGTKYVLYPRAAADEFFRQLSPPDSRLSAVRRFGTAQSRVVLGTSPSWALMQFPAETAQALAAVGPLRLAKGIKAQRSLSPKAAADLEVIAGAVPGSAGMPSKLHSSLRRDDATRMDRAMDAVRSTVVGDAILKGADSLGTIDRWKGGGIRKAVTAAHLDREVNGFLSGMKGLFNAQSEMTKALRGKGLEDQLAWLRTHPAELRKVERYLDDTMGNWRAISHNERVAAAFGMFYPFVRMSLRWTLWSFPKRHPLKAALIYNLGAANQRELTRLLGHDPNFFQGFATAVIDTEEPQGLNLSRITPGLNTLSQAVGGGIGPQILGAGQPVIGAALGALFGQDAFTGKEVIPEGAVEKSGRLYQKRDGEISDKPYADQVGKLALASLMRLPYPVRAIEAGTRRKPGELPLIGEEEPKKDDLFARLYPSPTQRQLGTIAPLPEPISKLRDREEASRAIKRVNYGLTSKQAAYKEAYRMVAKTGKPLSDAQRKQIMDRVIEAQRGMTTLRDLERKYKVKQ